MNVNGSEICFAAIQNRQMIHLKSFGSNRMTMSLFYNMVKMLVANDIGKGKDLHMYSSICYEEDNTMRA